MMVPGLRMRCCCCCPVEHLETMVYTAAAPETNYYNRNNNHVWQSPTTYALSVEAMSRIAASNSATVITGSAPPCFNGANFRDWRKVDKVLSLSLSPSPSLRSRFCSRVPRKDGHKHSSSSSKKGTGSEPKLLSAQKFFFLQHNSFLCNFPCIKLLHTYGYVIAA